MDKATTGGLITALGMLIFALFLAGDLMSFVSASSAAVTFGGALGATMINFTMTQVINGIQSAKKAISETPIDFLTLVDQLVSFAEMSRREGLLVLEKEMKNITDEFLRKGIQLVIDGTDQDMVKTMLEIEMAFIEERHKTIIKFWDSLGAMMPAWGMVGTIIGLIAMLKNLSDPSQVGPAMAVALLTTFYGAVGANLVAIPFAGKLKIRHDEEMVLKTVMIEGIVSVQAGDNPRMVREKLNVMLAPALRSDDGKGDDG